jgi:hypothetical protein
MFRHLIFEYLPHKQQQQCSAPTPSLSLTTKSSSDGCSVIEMLLGRAPVSCHPTSPTSSNDDDGAVQRREAEEKLVSEVFRVDQLSPMNIVDRLNEAIRRAQHETGDDRRRMSDAQHPIAVEA